MIVEPYDTPDGIHLITLASKTDFCMLLCDNPDRPFFTKPECKSFFRFNSKKSGDPFEYYTNSMTTPIPAHGWDTQELFIGSIEGHRLLTEWIDCAICGDKAVDKKGEGVCPSCKEEDKCSHS